MALIPCSFCGSDSLQRTFGCGFWIICLGCGAHGPKKASTEEAEAAWNTRVAPEPAPVEVPAIRWGFEDDLPLMPVRVYNAIFASSKIIDGVRKYPYVVVEGKRFYLVTP